MPQLALLCSRSLLVALVLALPLVAFAQTLERIQQSGTFNVGFVPDQPPFSSKSGNNPPAGYAIDLCQRVAEAAKSKLDLPRLMVKYTPASIETGLDMVEKGQIDILCGAVTETLKRRPRVSFSIPIFTSGIGVLLREDAPYGLVRVLNGDVPHSGPRWRATINRGLVNHVYAVHAGTTSEDWVRKQIATLGIITRLITVDKHEEGVEMVVNHTADAYFADRVILEQYAARHTDHDELMVLDRYFTYEPLALAVARGAEDFRLLVDSTLSGLYLSGDFFDLYTRFFGAPSDMTRTLFKVYALP
jgi:polar amino acid transport system substrate-binding protein